MSALPMPHDVGDHAPFAPLPARCVELVFAPAHGAPGPAPWQAAPGTVLHLAAGGLALHLAPARWLLIDAIEPSLQAAADAGALVFDVAGKWRLCRLSAALGTRVLSAALDLAGILAGRDCAAVTLFDVPAVIARLAAGQEYLVCAHSSYAASLAAALRRAAA
jgi:sarcosine oxidase gamma subunit